MRKQAHRQICLMCSYPNFSVLRPGRDNQYGGLYVTHFRWSPIVSPRHTVISSVHRSHRYTVGPQPNISAGAIVVWYRNERAKVPAMTAAPKIMAQPRVAVRKMSIVYIFPPFCPRRQGATCTIMRRTKLHILPDYAHVRGREAYVGAKRKTAAHGSRNDPG
jgi:hypothetical protein